MQKSATHFSLKLTQIEKHLTTSDQNLIHQSKESYQDIARHFGKSDTKSINIITEKYRALGDWFKDITHEEPRACVYPFSVPTVLASEASRIMSKLRHPLTKQGEFVYYTQRAYEMLFYLAFYGVADKSTLSKEELFRYFLTPSAVKKSEQYALHRTPKLDDNLKNLVLCTLLRASLLPSLIFGKEIQENTSDAHIPDHALFKVHRSVENQQLFYVLNCRQGASFFDLKALDEKDWVFADPINATAGSIITVVQYLHSLGVQPRKIYCFHMLSSLQGLLSTIRALPEAQVYTLWLDPVLNESYYVLPGLGDSGDRINGKDEGPNPRNVIQLLADYGKDIISLYRPQIHKIESLILGSL